MKRRHVIVLMSISLLGILLPAQAADRSAAQMMDTLPSDTFFCVGTSGTGAVGQAFKESSLGRIWYDPGVQQFVEQVKSGLLAALPSNDIPVEDIQKLVRLVASCPIVAGVSGTLESIGEAGPSGFVFVKAGDKKDAIAALITRFEAMAGEGAIVSRRVAMTEMHAPKAQDEVPLCWGWQGDYFVLLVNDKEGAALSGLRQPESRATASAIPAELVAQGDLLFVWLDIEKVADLLEKAVAADSPDNAARMKDVLDKLGLADLQTLTLSMSFDDRNLVADRAVQLSQRPSGLLAAAKPIDLAAFDRVEAAAAGAIAWNVDIASVYATILGVVKSQVPDAAQQIETFMAAAAQATGIDIRAGLINNIAGPMVAYSLPPFQIPQAPNGGGVLMVEVNDPALAARSLEALGTFAASKAQDMLQIGSQKTPEGDTVHTWVIAPLAMLQIMPAWTISNKTLIVATQPALIQRALGQLKLTDPRAASVRSRDGFREMEAKLPSQVLSVMYQDSQTQIRSLHQQVQQFWPMLTVPLAQNGIRLPVLLPDIEGAIKGMPASWEYSCRDGNAFRSHYEGLGIEGSNVSVGGAAMGLAILMPALSKTKQISKRVVAATNLKGLGVACHVHANDYDGNFPPTLETLCETADVSPKYLESPRKPKGFDGPSFIYISGQRIDSPSRNVLAHENPAFCNDKMISVLYVDGSVEVLSQDKLEEQLAATRPRLGQ